MKNLLVIGAGAAGLFAAGIALANGHKVTIVEHMPSPGQKLLITGKGRCNISNNCDVAEFLNNVRSNPKFLFSALHAFSPYDTMNFFENVLQVPLKTERGRRVFPKSDKAEDVLLALEKYAADVKKISGFAQELILGNGKVKGVVLKGGRKVFADKILVATGGISYPITGSTGQGYLLAKQAGHNVVPPVPSLVSMVERGNISKKMLGLSLRNVNLSLLENGASVFSEQGEMIFTHFGVSGPLVLSASAYFGNMNKNKYAIKIDLKPALSFNQLDDRIQRDFAQALNKDVANSLDKLLPAKMRAVVVEKWGIDQARKVNQVTREERAALAEIIKGFCIEIADRGDIEHAVITSGGVNVKEIDPKTMQSKLVKNLYFAGEVLDVDAYTGGYNLQIAWSTAFARGMFDITVNLLLPADRCPKAGN